jgi:hypothetical protein
MTVAEIQLIDQAFHSLVDGRGRGREHVLDRHSLLLIDETAVPRVPRIFRGRTENHAREPMVITNV